MSSSAVVFASVPHVAFSEAKSHSCLVKPSGTVDVSVNTEGVLAEIPVGRGSEVRQGDLIARLRDEPERAQLALAERRANDETQIRGAQSRLAIVKAQLDRAENLHARDLLSKQNVDETRAELIAVRQELDRAREEHAIAGLELARTRSLLEQLEVRSPIDGIITKRFRDAGEYGTEQEPIVSIAALDPLHIEAFLPITLHAHIKIGERATVVFEEPIEGRYEATVDVLDRVFDAASGTFGVRLVLANPGGKLPAGVRCQLTFDTPES